MESYWFVELKMTHCCEAEINPVSFWLLLFLERKRFHPTTQERFPTAQRELRYKGF